MSGKQERPGRVILALDTSSKAASAAILQQGQLLGEFFVNTVQTHSHTILPMVHRLLECTGRTIHDIDVFAVSTGPGSFTGLRIGIAAVKGMALAGGKPCAAVSTLAGLAENLSVFEGTVVPVMDARRDQVYTAAFAGRGGALARIAPDRALSIAALKAAVVRYPGPVMLVGDGAALCKAAMEKLPQVLVAPEALRHQRAASVAAVAHALADGALCSAGELTPAYLRLPQAERERMAKLQPPTSKGESQ